jgi:hypothetical protein
MFSPELIQITKNLIDNVWIDELPTNLDVYAVYFYNCVTNDKKLTEKYIGITFGVYQGMIKFLKICAVDLMDHYLNNTLDELIHNKYKSNSSGYYEQFVENKIILKHPERVPEHLLSKI